MIVLLVALVLTLPAPPLDSGCPAEVIAGPWPTEQACAVSWCESRWQADAYNHAGPYRGLFQIWDAHVAEPERLFDAAYNVEVAVRLWRAGGWLAWECRPT